MHHSTFRNDIPTEIVGSGAQTPLSSGRGFIALLEAFRATGGAAPGDVVGGLLAEHNAGHTVDR